MQRKDDQNESQQFLLLFHNSHGKQVGADLFELRGEHYLLVVDYFSRFPEVIKLAFTTSISITAMLKTIFSRHGIPEIVHSNNGSQFTSSEVAQLGILTHHQQLSLPSKYGEVEHMVQTIKGILKSLVILISLF